MARNLTELLRESGDRYSELVLAEYVRPHGLNLHLVIVGGQSIKVPSVAGTITFAPGMIVVVARLALSRNQRLLLGKPPSGSGGGGLFAVRETLTNETVQITIDRLDPNEITAGSVDAPSVAIGLNLLLANSIVAIDVDQETGELTDRTDITIEIVGEATGYLGDLFGDEQAIDILVTIDAGAPAPSLDNLIARP